MSELAQARRVMSGLEYMRKLVAGELESSPMARLLNIRIVDAAGGVYARGTATCILFRDTTTEES